MLRVLKSLDAQSDVLYIMDMKQPTTRENEMQKIERLPVGQSVKVWLEESAPYPAIGEVVLHDKGDNAVVVVFNFSEDHDLGGQELIAGEHLVEARHRNPWEIV